MMIWLLQDTPLSAVPSGPAVPTWGWITIVFVLASVVATLAGLYKSARDREVAANAEKVTLVQENNVRVAALLERAVEAFTLNRTGNDQIADKLEELNSSMRDLKEEVRRLGEKSR